MIKTLQTKLRLGSLKSDCQFHSYQGDSESGLRTGKREGIYEPGVGFDWAMIIPSKMITVRHPSDPVRDRISHFLLSFCSRSSECVPAPKPQQNTCMLKQEVIWTPSGCRTVGETRQLQTSTCYLRHIKVGAKAGREINDGAPAATAHSCQALASLLFQT